MLDIQWIANHHGYEYPTGELCCVDHSGHEGDKVSNGDGLMKHCLVNAQRDDGVTVISTTTVIKELDRVQC
jgi:hypothetical protein